MASTRIDIYNGTTCKIRVTNPNPTAILLYQDTNIRKVERIQSIIVVSDREHEGEDKSFSCVRRIYMSKPT